MWLSLITQQNLTVKVYWFWERWRISSGRVGKPYILHHFLIALSDTPNWMDNDVNVCFWIICQRDSREGRSILRRLQPRDLLQHRRHCLLPFAISWLQSMQTLELLFLLFLPANVSVCVWQFGHKKRRLSILLFVRFPSMWSTWRTKIFLFHFGNWLQILHSYCRSPSSNIFFRKSVPLFGPSRFAYSSNVILSPMIDLGWKWSVEIFNSKSLSRSFLYAFRHVFRYPNVIKTDLRLVETDTTSSSFILDVVSTMDVI